MPSPISFDNSYARLPNVFYVRTAPTAVAAPKLLKLNYTLAQELGLDAGLLSSPEGLEMVSGNGLAAGAEPLAAAYAGHQFGQFSPQLGDGRAILLGEIIRPDGQRRDLQLKGAGRTQFSRRGDGRAALGPVLREYIVSEAMAALGVPTTRSLAAVATGEFVARERRLPGAVLTRVASSHIRIGTFEFFAARGDETSVRQLADYAIARHYREAALSAQPYLSFLEAVVIRQAELIAHWLLVGFVHGVMNTDNMSICGETIDYGPCAFLDAYDPAAVFSSIDSSGRYAYGQQPRIAQWNLARFAECLLFLLSDDPDESIKLAHKALNLFSEHFYNAYSDGLRRKLGLTQPLPDDPALAQDLLELMARGHADFTLTFRRLGDAAYSGSNEAVRSLFDNPDEFDEWAARWRQRLMLESVTPSDRLEQMRKASPAFIPRNHRIEEAIKAAEDGDFKPFNRLTELLRTPYADQPNFAAYENAPLPHELVTATFCGT